MTNPTTSINIAPETIGHLDARSKLIHHGFGVPNRQRAAHLLRADTAPDTRYSAVALDQHQQLLGSVRFYPLLLPDLRPVLMLGPLVVSPELRGLGIGSRLIHHGLEQLQQDQWPGVVVIGDPGYFAPLGFRAGLCATLDARGEIAPLVLMGLEWQPGFLSAQTGTILPFDEDRPR